LKSVDSSQSQVYIWIWSFLGEDQYLAAWRSDHCCRVLGSHTHLCLDSSQRCIERGTSLLHSEANPVSGPMDEIRPEDKGELVEQFQSGSRTDADIFPPKSAFALLDPCPYMLTQMIRREDLGQRHCGFILVLEKDAIAALFSSLPVLQDTAQRVGALSHWCKATFPDLDVGSNADPDSVSWLLPQQCCSTLPTPYSEHVVSHFNQVGQIVSATESTVQMNTDGNGIKEDFFYGLYISLDWMNSGESLVARYEELWRDPVATLTRLTDDIRPVSQDRIESAIDLCDISMLRRLRNDPQGKVFRKGGPGGWRRELPDDIVDILRQHEPYATLFRDLGYTLDPHDPLIDAPPSHAFLRIPFWTTTSLKPRWRGSKTETGDSSFFAWVNAPADADIRRRDDSPTITNLAHYIYGERPDLQTTFPDLFGEDRHRFGHWFITHAQTEYALDKAFIEPTRGGVKTTSLALYKRDNVVRSLISSLYRKLSSLVSMSRKPR